MIIIGLSGTNGSGKDTLGNLLAGRHNLLFISVSDLLREEARSRGLEVTRENLRTISAEWRREFGLGVLVDRAIELCESHGTKYAGVIACPMRNEAEAKHLQERGGTLLWVDADPHVRYERIQRNAEHRGRAGEDQKTFEEFQAEEAAEMHSSGDSATLNMAAVKAAADVTIVNDDNDMDAFLARAEQALRLAEE